MSDQPVSHIGPVAPEKSGSSQAPVRGQAAKTPTTQAQAASMYWRYQEEERISRDAERHAWRLRTEDAQERILVLTGEVATLRTESKYERRERRVANLILMIAGTMTVMGSAVIDFAKSDAIRLVGLIVTAIGAFWTLGQGVIAFVSDEHESIANRRLAIVLSCLIIALLLLNIPDIAEFVQHIWIKYCGVSKAK